MRIGTGPFRANRYLRRGLDFAHPPRTSRRARASCAGLMAPLGACPSAQCHLPQWGLRLCTWTLRVACVRCPFACGLLCGPQRIQWLGRRGSLHSSRAGVPRFDIEPPLPPFACPVRRSTAMCQPIAARQLGVSLLSGTVGYCRVLSGPVGSCRVLSGTLGYVLSGTLGSCRVLSGTLGYSRILSGTVGSSRVLSGLPIRVLSDTARAGCCQK